MSSVSIQGNASGTGIFTIASPNSNTNRTLTLPDNTGTILTSATTTGFPAGSVLQVVQGTTSTDTAISSTSYTDTSITASITPSSASSKILVLASISGRVYINSNGNRQYFLAIVRGSTVVYNKQDGELQAGTGTSGYAIWPIFDLMYLDSPATTSSTTYKVQGKVSDTTNATTIQVNAVGNGTSAIILMEIAA
jgi:hypothetical protein